MKILIIDEKKTRREELASVNEEVNNTLKNCDQLHILTGNECNTFIPTTKHLIWQNMQLFVAITHL